jgi:hypothetical protein
MIFHFYSLTSLTSSTPLQPICMQNECLRCKDTNKKTKGGKWGFPLVAIYQNYRWKWTIIQNNILKMFKF